MWNYAEKTHTTYVYNWRKVRALAKLFFQTSMRSSDMKTKLKVEVNAIGGADQTNSKNSEKFSVMLIFVKKGDYVNYGPTPNPTLLLTLHYIRTYTATPS